MTETISELPKELEKELVSGRVIFGTKSVFKALKLGNAKLVIFAANTPTDIIEDLKHYAKLSNAKIQKFEDNNNELGTKCKKAHGVLAIALIKKDEYGK